MSKYAPLARHLSEQESSSVTMTFDEINNLVTGGLPQSAYDYRPWWANRYDGSGSQNQGWQSVGWESGDVNMEDGEVTFTRAVRIRQDFTEAPFIRPLSLAEAKQGLAKMFNVTPENVEINIRG